MIIDIYLRWLLFLKTHSRMTRVHDAINVGVHCVVIILFSSQQVVFLLLQIDLVVRDVVRLCVIVSYGWLWWFLDLYLTPRLLLLSLKRQKHLSSAPFRCKWRFTHHFSCTFSYITRTAWYNWLIDASAYLFSTVFEALEALSGRTFVKSSY